MKKQMLAALLAVSAAASGSFAAEPEKDAVQDLQQLGIIEEARDMRLEDSLTRAEAVKIITAMTGMDEAYTAAAAVPSFPDVPAEHWAFKYVEYAHAKNVVNGDENGRFNPDASVTYAQFAKMLVKAAGYSDFAENEGGYPAGYIKYAMKLNFNDDLGSFTQDEIITRGKVIQMAHNALDTPMCMATGFRMDSAGAAVAITEIMDGTGPSGSYKTLRTWITGMNESSKNEGAVSGTSK